MRIQLSLIFFISVIFAVIVGSGGYGYGVDYYAAYHKPNLDWGGVFDHLGFRISTLTIYSIHLGVYVVSFILSISSGLMFYQYTYHYFTKKYRWLFYSLFIVLIHTWPVIMSTSNAMRQGLTMSFMFFGLYFFSTRKYFLFLFVSLLGSLVHKSGILFASVLLFSGLTIYFFQAVRLTSFSRRVLLLIIVIALTFSLHILIDIFFPNRVESYIIEGDFRYPFLIINLIYILAFFIFFIKREVIIDYYLFFLSCFFPIFFLNGFNWEYERLNMIVLIPYMISFSGLFVLGQRKVLLVFSLVSLLILTILTGMYESLK